MKRLLLWVPVIAFALLFLVVARGLYRPSDRTVQSAMVGQRLPAFSLPPLLADKPGLASSDFGAGEPKLLNVFASWCVPCVSEAPVLLKIRASGVTIEGIAVRDTRPAMQHFLMSNGDAYARIGSDVNSRVQIALGSSGVPESFIIDGRGRIALQHVGELNQAEIPQIIAAVRNAR